MSFAALAHLAEPNKSGNAVSKMLRRVGFPSTIAFRIHRRPVPSVDPGAFLGKNPTRESITSGFQVTCLLLPGTTSAVKSPSDAYMSHPLFLLAFLPARLL